MWVRGLKLALQASTEDEAKVAPYVGAWIETLSQFSSVKNGMSHPMWVRGLKHEDHSRRWFYRLVAPYVGAWIETILQVQLNYLPQVAPYVGAWIETANLTQLDYLKTSHPMWVRGLKLDKE